MGPRPRRDHPPPEARPVSSAPVVLPAGTRSPGAAREAAAGRLCRRAPRSSLTLDAISGGAALRPSMPGSGVGPTRRRGMTVTGCLRSIPAVALVLLALTWPAAGQQPPPTSPPPATTPAPPPQPMTPMTTTTTVTPTDPLAVREAPLPAPSNLRFPAPAEVTSREVGVEEAVAIALANQPTIQTRAAAYLAA